MMNLHTVLVRLLYYPVKTLGPGRRIGIWFQGCSIGCKGCITPENQPFDPYFEIPMQLLNDRIKQILKNELVDGVTISGGEPFDQPEALAALVKNSRTIGVDDILVYSGYSKGCLLRDYPETVKSLTALVDGPFLEGLFTEAPWKGSENQNLTVFDPRHAEKYTLWAGQKKRQLQTARYELGIYLIGIPRQQDTPLLLEKVRNALSASPSINGERSNPHGFSANMQVLRRP